MMIVTANHNGAEGRSIDLRSQSLFCDHAVYLVVIRDNRSQFTTLALVADKTLERVENVFEAIIEIEDGELGIPKVETNLNFKLVCIRILNVASVLDLDDGCVKRPAPRWAITHKVWYWHAQLEATLRHNHAPVFGNRIVFLDSQLGSL